MSETLSGVLRGCALKLLEDQPTVTPEEVIKCAYTDHPSVFSVETERLVRNAAVRVVKDILRELSGDEEDQRQQPIPGLDLPTAIAVPVGDGQEFVYVRSDKATLPQLELGELIRLRNVEAAVQALDRYRLSVSRLRPFFKTDKTTAAQAYKLWRRSQKASAAG